MEILCRGKPHKAKSTDKDVKDKRQSWTAQSKVVKYSGDKLLKKGLLISADGIEKNQLANYKKVMTNLK
jgi:hypothetical protein